MAAKFIVLALFVAAAQGSGDYTSFSYGVSDPHTGDVKSQTETRAGSNVVGQYSLLESDGTRRTVDYAADAHSGFNAVVRRDPAIIAAPAAITAPAVVAAQVAPWAARVAPVATVAQVTPWAARLAPWAARVAPVATVAQVAPWAARVAPVAVAAPLGYNSVAGPLAYGAINAPLAHGAIAAPLTNTLGYAGW